MFINLLEIIIYLHTVWVVEKLKDREHWRDRTNFITDIWHILELPDLSSICLDIINPSTMKA